MPREIRRIVTARDTNNKSYALHDGPAANTLEVPHRRGVWCTQLWLTDETPEVLDGFEDKAEREIVLHPPDNGSAIRYVEFPPERDYIGDMDAAKAKEGFASIEAPEVSIEDDDSPHLLMHCTRTIDYEICISGEIYLILDNSEHLMKPGDVAVQRGTNHAWANRSEKSCLMAFIQMPAGYSADAVPKD
jgi:naringenin degradation protein FdeH